ncbi:MAG TPA: hypothetical protein VD972_34250, partial [Hyalangium sp.]|nr:hypothetical protein [Hyalangium sp.]
QPDDVRVHVVPEFAAVSVGLRQTFSASVSGTANPAVTWSVVGGSANGSISAEGNYTAPGSPGIYRVAATSVADPSKSHSVDVFVQSSGAVAAVISPATATLAPGAFQTFTFTSGAGAITPSSVNWSVLEADLGGAVSPTGLYRAPPTEGTYHLLASSYDGSYAVATLRVAQQATPTVSVLPGSARLRPGQQQSFAAYVTESSNSSVTWSATGGFIDSGGVFTAPAVPGAYTLRATSVAVPQVSQTVQVVVVDDFREGGMVISPTMVTVPTHAYYAFTGANSGASDNAVYWRVLEGPAGGSITARGGYIAPSTPGTYTVVLDGGGFYSPLFAYALVRVVEPSQTSVSVLPAKVQVPPGGKLSLIASVSGNSDTRVEWTTSGGFLQGALYTAPAVPGTYAVTATSTADPTKSASATVTVSGQPGVISLGLSPAEQVVAPGAFASFQLHLSGISSTSATATLTRVLEAPEGGTVIHLDNGTVEYFAPRKPGRYHVSASFYPHTSTESSEGLARVSVSPRAGVSVSLRPHSATLPTEARQTFTAGVLGSANTQVNWSATGGSISLDGTYLTPSQPGAYTVTATSVADPTQSVTVPVQVVSSTSAAAVSLFPSVVHRPPGGTVTFLAEASSPFFPFIYWRVLGGPENGSIDYLGNYTAPITPGVYYVMASSVDADWYAHAIATVIVE